MKRWLFTTAAAAVIAAGGARGQDPAVAPVNLTVTVPVGATLTVNGQRTGQMTAVRHFISPPLPAGKVFLYSFTATYTHRGTAVTRTQTVEVSAGSQVAVDMFAAREEAAPATKRSAPESDLPRNKFDVPNKPAPKADKSKSEPKSEADDIPPPPKSPSPPVPKKENEPETATTPEKNPGVKKAEGKKPEIEVPYVPTPEKVVTEMLKLAGVKAGDVVYDLGCGDGRIAIAAVKDFHAKKGLGVDYNPERVADSKAAAKKAGDEVAAKLEFKEGDVLKLTEKDFEGVDVVTLYLLPEVNLKLKPVLKKGLKPGARIVSHDFDMGDDWKPEKTVTTTDADGIDHTVYLWTVPAKK